MPASSRSAKTNGRRQFVDGDGRGLWARRWRDLKTLYADDLGGESALSEFQLGLIGTCATLRCELERLEGLLSLGESIDLDLFARMAGHYGRLCKMLGISRVKRDVTPAATLQDYVKARHAEAAADEEAD
jgi:hypothetical protein